MSRKRAVFGPMTCLGCSLEVERRSAAQKYCTECSINRDRERKAKWAAKTPPTPEQIEARNQYAKERTEALRAHGALRQGDGTGAWLPAEMGSELIWMVRVRVPFSQSLSKNAIWSSAGGGGHVFMREKARLARNTVRQILNDAFTRAQVHPVEAKVYIDLFVQKPSHRSDAINVIDSVCDGIKDALGIDDRWFCIRGLDWEVVKHGNPCVWIGVGQATNEHHRVCSYCGGIKPLTQFSKSARNKLGHGRECTECSRLPRSLRKVHAS